MEVDSQPRRRRSQYSRPSSLPARLATTLAFLVAAVMGGLAYFLPAAFTAVSATSQPLPQTSGTARPVVAAGAPFTLLLLGSDDDSKFPKDRVNTQSMILVRVVPATHQVTMLSIPRDLYVPLSTGIEAKISLAYSFGGAATAVATVEKNFNVRIDEYAWIGLKGLVGLVDELGGVDLVVSNPVLDDYFPDDLNSGSPFGFQRIAVLPGPQHLDGIHALQYVRSRHSDVRSDFGRSQRQQQLLLALKQRAKSVNITDLPRLAGTFSGEFKTSLGIDKIQALLPLATSFNTSDIHQIFLAPPLTTETILSDSEDVLIPDWPAILPLVAANFPSR